MDEIVGGDGKRRYNLVRDDGSMAAQNVQIVKAYTPEQEGSTFGAVDVYDLQCKEYTITLTADGWVDGQQTVSLPEIQADAGTVFVGLPADATLEEMGLVGSSGLKCIGRSEGALIFSCLLGEPSTEINVNVVLTGGQPSIVNAIGGIGADEEALYVTEEITNSRQWTVPNGVSELEVTCIGGGGGGGGYCGGGGGYRTIKKIAVTPNEAVSIIIGAGGGSDADGGTTSFGEYAAASGGQHGGTNGCGGSGGTGGGAGAGERAVGAGNGQYGGDGGAATERSGGAGGSTDSAMGGLGIVDDGWSSGAGTYYGSGGGGGAGINGGNGGNAKTHSFGASLNGMGGGGGGYGSLKLATDGTWEDPAGYEHSDGGEGGLGYGAGGGGDGANGKGGKGAPGICIIKYRKF